MPQELPKLSTLTQVLMTPEAQFEKMVRGAAKIELPPGPQSALFDLQTKFEVGKPPMPEEAAKTVLARLPKLEGLPAVFGGGGSEEKRSTLLEEREVKAPEARVLL